MSQYPSFGDIAMTTTPHISFHMNGVPLAAVTTRPNTKGKNPKHTLNFASSTFASSRRNGNMGLIMTENMKCTIWPIMYPEASGSEYSLEVGLMMRVRHPSEKGRDCSGKEGRRVYDTAPT
jgi:hypothetical protein